MGSIANLYNAEKTVEDMTEYIEGFIAKRFPDLAANLNSDNPDVAGNAADFKEMLCDIIYDAFADGALYAENANGIGSTRIIANA